MLVRHRFLPVTTNLYIFAMFLESLLVLVVCCPFLNLLVTITSSLSFIIFTFLSRIGTRGTFCLEVACAMDFMHLIWRLPSSFQWCPCAAHWHAQLGHPATPIVRSILHRHDLPVASNKDVATVCDACQQGKSHQLPFSESRHVVKTPLELVFSDVWGHAQTSVGDHNYYVSFIDAYSRFT